jgi:hypothetical protein
MTKIAGSGSISQRHGSADPDLYQNAMDRQQWYKIRIRDEQPGSDLRELGTIFKGKILKFWMRIRDKYPGPATLV